ncbi:MULTISPECIES: hypothetical protein [unclassified Crossiella]|uniref:hypothetical protein n=1 Tax=unclassified Crossiella TaxID=2620835 RepID=UPI001FFEFBFD|nr:MULTISPECIES: hypothetical protein [unclassified Crossiella]MCK2242162.1 hypothetical protein [Crossiella sp. S99.2]MCK2256065.1 hypothetical protein [Crossiella sp. S99.1]
MAELDPGRMATGRPVATADERRAGLAAACWVLGTGATGDQAVQVCADLLHHLGLTAFARQPRRRKHQARGNETPSADQGATWT